MADEIKSLYLSVDASIELLRKNLAAGVGVLDQFEGSARRSAQRVDDAIGSMGGRFGVFADLAKSAAEKAETSFDKSFTEIQKLAARAIEAPSLKSGAPDLGVGELRAAAEAARQQALALGLIEQAAIRAATGGEILTKDTAQLTQETRIYIQAAQAARIEAERSATDLEREAGALERLQIEFDQAAGGARLFQVAQRGSTVSAGQLRAGTQQLSYQIGDVAASFASGTGIIQIFGQQIGQTIQAVTLMRGEAGGLVGFLAGPWGAALTGAVVVAAALASKLLDGADAHRAQAGAAKSLEDAIRDLDQASAREVLTQRQVENAAYNAATAMRQQEIDTRRLSKAKLQAAQDELKARKLTSQAFGERGSVAALGLPGAFDAVNTLQAEIDKQDKAIQQADAVVRRKSVPILQRMVTEATDASAAATGRYERAIGSLNQQLVAGTINQRQFLKASGDASRQLEREQDAIKATEKSGRTGRSSGGRTPRTPAEHIETAAEAKRRLSYEQGPNGTVSDQLLRNAPGSLGTGIANADIAAVGKIADEAIKGVDAFYAQAEQRTNDLASTFYDALSGRAGSFWDSFRRLGLAAVAQIAARLLTNNGGAGGGFGDILKSAGSTALSSIFGGFRASGGPVSAGVPYIVGERGPELIVPNVSSRVIPNHALGGAGGVPRTLSLTMTVHGVSNRAEMEAIGTRAGQAAYQAAVATSRDDLRQMYRPDL